jgi:hypothetical protein
LPRYEGQFEGRWRTLISRGFHIRPCPNAGHAHPKPHIPARRETERSSGFACGATRSYWNDMIIDAR